MQSIPFKDIPQLSAFDKAYATQNKKLQPFIQYQALYENFDAAMDAKKHFPNRDVLVTALKKQYQSIENSAAILKQIELLTKPNTFTICTAHQPSLLTGPLYVIYKALSAIKLARNLKTKYPEKHFLPVFFIGAEDHDFAEINHLHLFRRRFEWSAEEHLNGPTGLLPLDSLLPLIEEIKALLGDSPNALLLKKYIEQSFTENRNYGEATQAFLHCLFEPFGLIILLPGSRDFKNLMRPYFKQELLHSPSIQLVEKTNLALENAGFKAQAFPREINLFYTEQGIRSRLIREGNTYRTANSGGKKWSEAELLDLLEKEPEKFSPNVILRPLYQEVILPNIAYIGGGGELAYWVQLKAVFEANNVPFPMLVRRDSAWWIDAASKKKLAQLGLEREGLLLEEEELLKLFVKQNSEVEIDFSKEINSLELFYEKILEKVNTVDPSLEKTALAELKKFQNGLDNLQKKLIKSEKRKAAEAISKIRNLKHKHSPKNGLQERYDNFISYFIKGGHEWMNTLLDNFDPLNMSFKVFEE